MFESGNQLWVPSSVCVEEQCAKINRELKDEKLNFATCHRNLIGCCMCCGPLYLLCSLPTKLDLNTMCAFDLRGWSLVELLSR